MTVSISASASSVVLFAAMVLSNKSCLFGSAFSSLLVFSSKGILSKLRLKLDTRSYSSLKSENLHKHSPCFH